MLVDPDSLNMLPIDPAVGGDTPARKSQRGGLLRTADYVINRGTQRRY